MAGSLCPVFLHGAEQWIFGIPGSGNLTFSGLTADAAMPQTVA